MRYAGNTYARPGSLAVVPEAELCPRRFWNSPSPFTPLEMLVDDRLPVYANEGRWVVMCPDCNGAQLAAFTDPRFYCVECANLTVSGAWRSIAWPANRVDIETALAVRPLKNQNWQPGETVDDLLAENDANGYGPTGALT